MSLTRRPSSDFPQPPRFQVRQCTQAGCGLRFTIQYGDPRGEHCPFCRAPANPVEAAYERYAVQQTTGAASGPELEVLLDNIRSAWNVGSMLRSADGAGVRQVHLCGVSATPENPKVAKTALGAERSMPWSFHHDGVSAALAMRNSGMRLWALEGGARAESLYAVDDLHGSPIALVVGNELSGVDPGLLELCDRVVSLPMLGIKGSLNVAVAFGIAVYHIRFAG
jgi:tRNA G18 (ribose-2'-O)-methylase SpoU